MGSACWSSSPSPAPESLALGQTVRLHLPADAFMVLA